MGNIRNVVLMHGGFVDGFWLAGRLRPAEGRWLQGDHRAEPDHLAGGRRGGYKDRARRPGRTGGPRRPLLWWRGNHRGRNARQGPGTRLHIGVRAR